jgi:DNA helicase-2/ATP-dependent DNA helicase PcrA
VRRKVQDLFEDREHDDRRVACSTVHAAKGLERDVVWMVGDTFRVLPGNKPRDREERNLYYVAVTRAKRELRIVGEINRRPGRR